MLLAPLVVAAAALCRYTVRDIGFVDLAGATYSFARVGPEEIAVDLAERLRDTNLAYAALPVGATADPRVAAAGPQGGWVLHREGLAPLVLARLDGTANLALEAALHSELRDVLLARAVDSFAVLVVVEGERAEDRARIEAELAAAREGLGLLSAQLPRPIVRPLAELRVRQERRAEERVLLWALGLAQESRAAVALVYGRGRLAGEVLVGDAVERGELLAQLALVGESCECDTDRDWLGAPSLPLAWTAPHRARAAADLGFEPESPLVRAEVARILERGRPAGPSARARGVDDVVFGYDEGALEARATADESSAADAPDARNAPDVRVFEANGGDDGGDDWGFEATTPEPAPTRRSRPVDPLLLAGLVVLGLVTVGVGAVLLTRGTR